MALKNVEKTYFTFTGGINTDASPLTFPEDMSLDEQNYELMIDGSRRRRRGLALESDGETFNFPSWDTDYVVRCHKWHEVGGDPDVNFVVMQVGTKLYFFDDNVEPVSTTLKDFTIDLETYAVSGAVTSDVATNPTDTAYGRGYLFVTHRYLKPFWVQYDAAADSLTITTISIEERDFQGVDDGIATSAEPTTLTDDHRYNLLNRGWQQADIDAYFASQSKYPSKAMVPWLGYRRVSTSGVAEVDWSKEFSPAKLISELFQDVSAPTGHFVVSAFDSGTTPVPTTTIPITTWTTSTTTPSASATITITTDSAHGLSPLDTVYITGNLAYYSAGGLYLIKTLTLDGTYTVDTTPTGTTFTFTYTWPSDFVIWISQYYKKGSMYGDAATTSDGLAANSRPTSVEFFAGRVWFAGTPYDRLSTKVFFSQTIESNSQYGKCYQGADPTDERISDLVDTDGGVIIIPEATQIHQIVAYSGSLLVFAQSGVWEIGGGTSGYFTATSYRVRKISDIGSMGAGAVVVAENIPFYWGQGGIYRITQDPNSGYLTAVNITYNRINTLYTGIATNAKYVATGVYDDVNKRVIWLYNSDASVTNTAIYNAALVYDLRYNSFVRHSYGGSVRALFTLRNADLDTKVKWVRVEDDGDVLVADTSSLDFIDFGLTEPTAYLLTGYEVLGDPSRWKYAPLVFVYHKKTETGYTDNGDGTYDPVNPGSTLMQVRFDWADNTVAGKWGSSQETYRHRRLYTPVSASDVFADGQPIIVTRNKVRGRGRSTHVLFSAGTGKDSHLLGWQTKYDALTIQ